MTAISFFATKCKSTAREPIVTSQWGQCHVRGPRQQPSKSLRQRQVCRRTTRDYGVQCLTRLETRTGVSTNNTRIYAGLFWWLTSPRDYGGDACFGSPHYLWNMTMAAAVFRFNVMLAQSNVWYRPSASINLGIVATIGRDAGDNMYWNRPIFI